MRVSKLIIAAACSSFAGLVGCDAEDDEPQWRAAVGDIGGGFGSPDCDCPNCFDSCWALQSASVKMSMYRGSVSELLQSSNRAAFLAPLGDGDAYWIPFSLKDMEHVDGRWDIVLPLTQGFLDNEDWRRNDLQTIDESEIEYVRQAINQNTDVIVRGHPTQNYVPLFQMNQLFDGDPAED